MVCDILLDILENPLEEMLAFIKHLGCSGPVEVNEKVAESERKTGFNNFAAAYLMKSFDNLKHPVEDVLDLYFHLCAIEMNCRQLAQTFYVFTNEGRCINNQQHLNISQTKRLNAIMMMCGFYDEAGDFAYEVGLPGKSGVAGALRLSYQENTASPVGLRVSIQRETPFWLWKPSSGSPRQRSIRFSSRFKLYALFIPT